MQQTLEQFRSHRFHHKGLKEYYARYSTPRLKPLIDGHVAERLRAQAFQWEDDPRSVFEPEKLFDALSKYAPGMVRDPKCDADIASGLALARICFAKPESEIPVEMLPFTLATIREVTKNPTGSAGLTAFGLQKRHAELRAYERGKRTLRGELAPEACIAFARTQFGGKTRLVWGFPYSQTAIEGLIAQPLLERFKELRTPMAFSMTKAVLGFRLRAAAASKKWAYSIDMTSFDSSISSFLVKQAFMIMRSWFNLDQIEPTTGLTCGQIFKLIERYFLTSSIVMPDGNIYHGRRHGVPSGSYFTQLVDSIVNVIIAGTISKRFNLHVGKRDIFVLGDDLLIWSDREMSLDVMARYASKKFGVEFNADKSMKYHFSDTIHYLGKDWVRGIPDLPLSEILKRMVHPERFRKYDRIVDRREREVSQLFVSYAMEYYCAWDVMIKCTDSNSWRYDVGDIQARIYGNSFDERGTLDPAKLSGADAYKAMYMLDGKVASSLYERSFL